jgi:hypothetical protein
MIDKFIILSQAPLTNKIFRDWFVEDLIKLFKKNFEFWTINEKLHKNKDPFKINKNYVKHIKNLNQYRNKIKENENKKVIFLFVLPLTRNNAKYLKMIKIKKSYFIYINWGTMPYENINLYTRILNKLYLFSKGKRFPLAKPKNEYHKLFDLIFYAGVSLKEKSDYMAKKIKQISLIDYDHYKKYKHSKTENIAVFLDQALTCHSDFGDFDEGKNKSHFEYYKSLEKFFLKVEKRYNIKIVIALHPKNYLSKKYLFKREVYINKTPQIVSKSKFVLCHTSLSISHAILNYKPIIFLDSKLVSDYSDFGEDRLIINSLKKSLDSDKFYFDREYDDINLNLKPNIRAYNNYIHRFIKSKSTPNISARKIFLNEIIKIKKQDN